MKTDVLLSVVTREKTTSDLGFQKQFRLLDQAFGMMVGTRQQRGGAGQELLSTAEGRWDEWGGGFPRWDSRVQLVEEEGGWDWTARRGVPRSPQRVWPKQMEEGLSFPELPAPSRPLQERSSLASPRYGGKARSRLPFPGPFHFQNTSGSKVRGRGGGE